MPDENYLPEEQACWTTIYTRLESMWPSTACSEFRYGHDLLVKYGLLKKDCIPNFSKISEFVKSASLFTLLPVSKPVPARWFLNCIGLVLLTL